MGQGSVARGLGALTAAPGGAPTVAGARAPGGALMVAGARAPDRALAAPGARVLASAVAAAFGRARAAIRALAAAATLAAFGLAWPGAVWAGEGSVGAPVPPPLRYLLTAPEGVPGNAKVVLVADRAGAWTVVAEWTGRDLASLRVEDEAGVVLQRRTGPSPLALSVSLDAPARLAVRFSPAIARGTLAGELRVVPPPEARPAVVAAPPAPHHPGHRGPGRCLAVSGSAEAEERAVRALADALETARPEAVDWCRAWTARLGRAASEPGRGALDTLWQDLGKEEPPDADVAAGLRQLLAAVEDLTRRAANPKNPKQDVARERRAGLLERISCLDPES